MEIKTQILDFLNRAQLDARLKPAHISVYMALFQSWILQGYNSQLFITRRQVMASAKLKSIGTYHKIIQQLQSYGYIRYIPSYDPRIRTMVQLTKPSY